MCHILRLTQRKENMLLCYLKPRSIGAKGQLCARLRVPFIVLML